MTIGASKNRDELVKILRGMQFSKLNIGFLNGESLDGKPREGYDKYGKFKIRFGWSIGAGLAFMAAVLFWQSFFPRRTGSYDDPTYVWIRNNFYWLLPVWAVPSYFLWKANRKEENSESDFLAKAVAKNGLVVLPGGTHFPGDLGYKNPQNPLYFSQGTVNQSSFAMKYDQHIRVGFGLSSLWWDESSSPSTNRGLNPTQSLFVYVSIPELTHTFTYVNPRNLPKWDQLPPMSEKAKDSLTKLASRYAVVIGGGGIGVGLAKDTNNGLETSLAGDMTVRSGWKVCYDLLSNEVADILQGLA
jgi:hypothetical protein